MELIKLDTQISKGLIEEQKQTILQRIEDGELDALKVMVVLTMYKKILEGDDNKSNGLRHMVESHARTEVYKYGKEAVAFGVQARIGTTGDRYDYDADPIYSDLKAQLKARENLLKTAVKMKESIFDESTGEVVPKVPLKSPAKETLVITIK